MLELAEEQTQTIEPRISLRVFPMFHKSDEVPVELAAGSHGGADPLLQKQIFSADAPPDNLGRYAGRHEQGAASALIDIAANRSMASGMPIKITDLCPLNANLRHLSELI